MKIINLTFVSKIGSDWLHVQYLVLYMHIDAVLVMYLCYVAWPPIAVFLAGEFAPEIRSRLKAEHEKRLRLDPWKVILL